MGSSEKPDMTPDEVVKKFRDGLVRFFNRNGAVNDAEDLSNEVLIEYCRSMERRPTIQNHERLLYWYAAKRLKDWIRRKYRKDADTPSRDDPDTGLDEQLSDPDAEGFEDTLLESDCIQQVLAALSDDDRTLATLVAKGYSSEEIAHVLGINNAAARQRISRMRKHCVEHYVRLCQGT